MNQLGEDNKYVGSRFSEFLDEEGISAEVELLAKAKEEQKNEVVKDLV